jgi:hypothetical protein
MDGGHNLVDGNSAARRSIFVLTNRFLESFNTRKGT